MGRIRKTARWTFSFGGTGAGSPIRAESSAESAARETNRLLAEQNRILSGGLASYTPVSNARPSGRTSKLPVTGEVCPACHYRGIHARTCSRATGRA